MSLHLQGANIQGGHFRVFSRDLNHYQHISVGSGELEIVLCPRSY